MSHPRHLVPRSQAQPPFFVGLDVGGTNIKVGVVDDQGQPLSWLSMPTLVPQGPEDAARRMGDAAREAAKQAGLDWHEIVAAGLGTPGPMDIPNGMLISPANLPGWRNFPIRDRVAHYCGLPVGFANDANAAAYGEWWVGAGRKYHSLALFTLGTGVGGGIIIGDLSIDGENSAGSELGHIIIDYRDDALLCTCGQRGHLEAYASATAVVARTKTALEAGGDSSLRPRIAAGEKLTSLMICEEADKGDALADQIVMETAFYLGIGAVTVMHTVDPTCVIFGGAMDFGGHDTPLGERFLQRIRTEVKRRAFPILAERTCIDYASLGGDAGYIGAAGIGRLAWRRQQQAK